MNDEKFTRYEVARILGARALQISMDAPILLKMSKEELEKINYDSINIAEKEFNAGILPISVNRPIPGKGNSKLGKIKEEKIDDEKIIRKEKEIEKEITESADELGFGVADENDKQREEESLKKEAEN
ncbi:DNA-directed RNA polymerase subunit K [Candidatus Parvarchaeota archaeon]|jgi:DNA-directed RNA polymerase subunit K|nr:MAG: DNA-directed RNA polymerase subunit K [Candidatus Parvarchaeota archaeon]HIG51874.1 DNA-directed RNA polymerase subunit K [Candidatus Pacearchaeota archaeon]